jgi:Protein of unknown function (DUF2510)
MAAPGSKRRAGTVFWLIVVIAIAVAGVIVAFKPLNTPNFQDACPSVVQALNGPFSLGQAARDAATGQCTDYLTQMITWLIVLSVLFVIALLILIIVAIAASAGRRRDARAAVAYPVAAPVNSSPAPTPGWYVATGRPGWQRYWDGAQWTENFRPLD